jgi:hypothetical protein
MTRIVLHVGRLVLNGFSPREQRGFVDSLRAELGSELGPPHVAAALQSRGDRAGVAIRPLRISAASKPRQAGVRIARGVARGITS